MNAVVTPSTADTRTALKFITCGSVDDGKSTLIGRLLVDSKAVLQDHLAGVQRQGETDLALLTDGLSAEREQGITIDVAYRYFNTETRKFIIGDAPGHEQYTRNMVTAASAADAAVVLVDATKLDWKDAGLKLLVQTRRHSLLVNLLRVPSIVFAVNKLDAVADSALAFTNISGALAAFAAEAGIAVTATVPVSALKGWNVVDAAADAGWCGYSGPTLLEILEQLPVTAADTTLPFAFPVQWVEKFSSSSDTSQGRRVFWGRVATGGSAARSTGQGHAQRPDGHCGPGPQPCAQCRKAVPAGHSAGIVLDREVDVSRGDWLLAVGDEQGHCPGSQPRDPRHCGLDGRRNLGRRPCLLGACTATAGSRPRSSASCTSSTSIPWPKKTPPSSNPTPSATSNWRCRNRWPPLPFAQSRALGSLVLVDTASHKTSGALLVG